MNTIVQRRMLRLLCLVVVASADRGNRPSIETDLGVAIGTYTAAGAERYGSIPYALPPLGTRRFARAEVNQLQWPAEGLNATLPSPPCMQAPAGDPRSRLSASGPPTEDCLTMDIFRPKPSKGLLGAKVTGLPVMVYVFGGGLCSGFAGSEYNDGSFIALKHQMVVVNVNYRLGPLGYLVGEDGTGGLNGLHDIVTALRWVKQYITAFGGDPGKVTLFGQSSGGYAICTLCVAPDAKDLFYRAILQSGPCVGGPPGRGWGPMKNEIGWQITQEILKASNATSIDSLRSLPAVQLQWPDEWMNDLDKAPYFSGYFEDASLVPGTTEELWKGGHINPSEVLVNYNTKDGTAAFYGTSPTLGLVPPDLNTNNAEGYSKALQHVWGDLAPRVEAQYPGDMYPSFTSAFMQADAEAYVICPLRRIVKYAATSGRRVWVSEFAHFQPSIQPPEGCAGPECQGAGCDNGVELDVVPGKHTDATKLWATHGTEVKYVFGTHMGPDGIGPPSNVTFCNFTPAEQNLSASFMAAWTSFARSGDPSGDGIWPPASVTTAGNLTVFRHRWAVLETDGELSGLRTGMSDAHCDFWDTLFGDVHVEYVV